MTDTHSLNDPGVSHPIPREPGPGDTCYIGQGEWGVVLPDGRRVVGDHPEAYRGRALGELRELSVRYNGLDLFLRSPKAQTVDDSERAMLRHQLRAMGEYLYWLRQRVRLWGVTV